MTSLTDNFPELFTPSSIIEINSGWKNIISWLCYEISDWSNRNKQVSIHKIIVDNGNLIVETNFNDEEEISDMITMYSILCKDVCEICGSRSDVLINDGMHMCYDCRERLHEDCK